VKCFATLANNWHKSLEEELKQVHNLLQAWASTQEGPAEPMVFRAFLMRAESMESKKTACVGGLSL